MKEELCEEKTSFVASR